ncbi:NAD(P)H-dependent oxidoreductase [Candidatus Izimaplasma bacterium]|nr:NAD(P)H-dependent oxidoreductase [Candidatus Izimaplasma bacterium]
MKKIGIIIGSVRENRVGIKIGEWILKKTENHSNDYEIVDLKEIDFPHYLEPISPRNVKEYKYETTTNWSNIVKKYDGYIFVSPEYNGYFPGKVKDAIDYLYHEWLNKSYIVVGYGGRGGLWASEKLSELLDRFDMKKAGILGVKKPWEAIDSNGNINEEYVVGDLTEFLNKL